MAEANDKYGRIYQNLVEAVDSGAKSGRKGNLMLK